MKYRKSALAMILATSMAFSSVFSFAASFNDMKNSKGEDHWSTVYVNDISSKGLVSGYADGSFKPNNPVTRIEAIVFISRLFPQENVKSVYEANKSKWEAKLTEHLIPEFAKAPVVYGLEKGLYTETYLKEFMNKTNKTQKEAQRYEFVVYLVRSLGWQSELSNAAVVKYKDVASIPKQAVPYVELLGKKGVIATEGDFNPLKSVTRGEIAKMISITYPSSERAKASTTTGKDETDKDNTNNQNTNGSPVMPSGTLVEGRISKVTADESSVMVTILKENGSTAQFFNKLAGVVVSIDGKAADARDVKEGYSVKLYTDGLTVKGIEVVSTSSQVNKTMTGELVSLGRNSIKIKGKSAMEEYDLASKLSITKNRKSAQLADLVVGDELSVKIEDSLITSIDAETVKRTIMNAEVKGVTSYANGTATVIVQDEDGTRYELEFNSNSRATKDRQTAGLSAIAVGYEATVYTNSNEIVDIILYGKAKGTVISGEIVEVNYREGYIYVKADGKEIKVETSRNTEIQELTSDKKTDIDYLEKGQKVIINGFEGASFFDATKIAYYK